jgi:hypothetical protein
MITAASPIAEANIQLIAALRSMVLAHHLWTIIGIEHAKTTASATQLKTV